MRILCSFVGGAGHLVPQLPLHEALCDAGHTLTLVGRSSAVRGAPGLYENVVAHPDRRSAATGTIAPLAPVDMEHELRVVERHFAGDAARESAARVAQHLSDHDLLVCDELDFGAMAVAQRAGIPVVVVAVIASGALVRPELLTSAFAALARDLSMAQDLGPRGDLFVIPFAPSMRDPLRADADALWMRPAETLPPTHDGSIVATLGTEFNTESGDLFDRILAALASIDAPSTLAIGRDLDVARFGRQPPHVRVEQFVDVAVLISRASVAVHHGGSGLFMQSVLGGAPQVLLPMGADQPLNAARVESLDIGDALDPLSASPGDIARSIRRNLDDAERRRRVVAVRASVVELPSTRQVVERIEEVLAAR